MKTKNFFINKEWFINFSYWTDYLGMFILPGFIFDYKLPLSSDIEINRFSIYFWKFRVSIDIGKLRNKNKEYNWKKAHMNEFLVWWRKEIKKPVNKEKVEKFIEENDYIKELLKHNSCECYYTKRFLFKKIVENKNFFQ